MVAKAAIRRGWVERRERAIWRMRVALALGGAALAAAITWLVPMPWPDHAAEIADALSNLSFFEIGWLHAAAHIAWLDALFKAHPVPIAAVGGGFHGALAGLLAGRLHDRFFGDFNDDVLCKLPALRAYDPLRGSVVTTTGDTDPPIAWVSPTRDSPRGQCWGGLLGFAREHVGHGRARWLSGRPTDPDFRPFRWALLTGRAGDGKTRMAVQLCRELARTEAPDRRALARQEWWRRAVPFLGWGKHLPWDTAWLTLSEKQSDATRPDQPTITAALADWWPRRPTALLLDDPAPDEACRVVTMLQNRQRAFRHAVRLLIVNQARPADLYANLGTGALRDGLALTHAGDFALGAAAELTSADVTAMARALALGTDVWDAPGEAVPGRQVLRFLEITRGNALLVELGLRELKAGRRVSDLTREALLADRVTRIIQAFAHAGLATDGHLRGFAAATIAGPSGGDGGVDANVQAGDILSATFHVAYDQGPIGQLFNLGPAGTPGGLPPVRPELIGDAFVRHVLKQYCKAPHQAELVVDTAWRLSPHGTLRSARRLAHEAETDLLARLLQRNPPESAGVDPVEWALLAAEIAMCVPRDDWDARDFAPGTPGLARAEARIAALTPAQAAQLPAALVALMERDNSVAVTRGWPAYACFCAAAARAMDDAASWRAPEEAAAILDVLIRMLAQMERWGMVPGCEEGTPYQPVPGRLLGHVMANGTDIDVRSALLDRLFSVAFEPKWDFLRQARAELLGALADANAAPDAGARRRLGACWLRAAEALMRNDPAAAHAMITTFEQECPAKIDHDDRLVLEAVRAQRMLTHDFRSAEQVRARAERVDAIAGARASTDPAFAVESAIAWHQVNTVMHAARRFDEVEAPADRVVAIASGYPANTELANRALMALLMNTQLAAERQDRISFAAIVARMEQITPPDWCRDRQSAFLIGEGRACLVGMLANAHDVANARATMEQVEMLSLPRFSGERRFELNQAQALMNLCAAHSNLGRVSAAREVIERVRRLVHPGFTSDEEFEHQLFWARKSLVTALVNAGDPVAAWDEMMRLEASMPDDWRGKRNFDLRRTEAWRGLAQSSANHGDHEGAARAAQRAAAIMHPRYTGDAAFEAEYAQVRPYLPVSPAAQPA